MASEDPLREDPTAVADGPTGAGPRPSEVGEAHYEPIAVVGMSGRFPGSADIAQLWANLRAGRSGITRFTDEELRAAGVPADLLGDPAYVKAGAVLGDIELFDAAFFGYTPAQAQILDPQQRLFLEHSWHALEDAGCDPSRFDGAIGVFGGCAPSTYRQHVLTPGELGPAVAEQAVALGNDPDTLTTRVAQALGLTGPAYGVQSHCSTSLVAVCAAATSLAHLECDLALAGGVSVSVPHRVGYRYRHGGDAPPDGECRAFDAAGLGSPPGSGVGVVALRRLADALDGGDRVYAVIRGWAVNNDGRRMVGLPAPDVQSRAAVIAQALASAGLTAADIDYVEAHGTGTALGDAAEIAALHQVFRDHACLLGSIKTNIGHLGRAAGVTGLIKAALALQHEEIPPTRNLVEPARQLRGGPAHLDVVTDLRGWRRRADRVRRAGVSAFGIGGTNAHVLLEEAPPVLRGEIPPRAELLVWSAHAAGVADAMTARLAEYFTVECGPDRLSADRARDRLADVAYTLQTGRRTFEHRRFLVASTVDEAGGAMRDAAALARTEQRDDRQVGFLIAGTGEQYPGMAADLHRTDPVFRAAFDECRAALTGLLDGADPLAEVLRPRPAVTPDGSGLSWLLGGEGPDHPAAGSGETDPADRFQPATFAIGYALARVLESWGVRPALMAGHGDGEYVAACLSGVLTVEAALALLSRRARLVDTLPPGAMAAVPLPAAELAWRMARAGIEGVEIAAINGAKLTVVSGEPDGVRALRAALAADAVVCRQLAAGHAFHSRMLEPVRDELTAWVAQHVTARPPRIPYVSTMTGALVTADEVANPGYWAAHMCTPVRFDTALATMLAQDDLALLELGPGQFLGDMARARPDCPPERWQLIVATLPAAGDPRRADTVLADAAGRLWLAGVPLDWDGYQQGRPAGKVWLPGYPFQRERHWIDEPAPQRA